jgi:hypothetical protein
VVSEVLKQEMIPPAAANASSPLAASSSAIPRNASGGFSGGACIHPAEMKHWMASATVAIGSSKDRRRTRSKP